MTTPDARADAAPTADRRRPSGGAIVLDWWRTLNPESGKPDRAALAGLRRCSGPDDPELLFSPAFHDLRRRLKAAPVERVATAAIVAAHVTAHAGGMRFARQLGPGDLKSDDGPMNEQRFRRLLQSEPGPDLTRALVRAVRLLDGRVNLADLAAGILWWNDGSRRRWAFDYFNAGDAAPGETANDGGTP